MHRINERTPSTESSNILRLAPAACMKQHNSAATVCCDSLLSVFSSVAFSDCHTEVDDSRETGLPCKLANRESRCVKILCFLMIYECGANDIMETARLPAPRTPRTTRATPSHIMAHINDISEKLVSLGLENPVDLQHSIYDLAIDFGTTFTKVGALRVWPPHKSRASNTHTSTLKSLLDDILIIDRYPGPYSSKHLNVEVPTTWVYNSHSLVSWGVDLDDYEDNEHITLGLVKLILDESNRGTTEKAKVKKKMDLVGLSVADILTDYLRVLVRHAAKILDSVDPNEKLIRVILCIPAIWQPLAQKTMREACQKALCTGMVLRDQEDHGLITEPEAVATFLMEKYPQLDVVVSQMIREILLLSSYH